MKDEIKEILEFKEDADYKKLSVGEILFLKDYITNLQEEIERLKEKYDNNKSHKINYKYFTILYSKATKDIVIDDLVYKCEDLDNLRQSYEKLYVEKEDYKSRNEKAIEYIHKNYYETVYKTKGTMVNDLLNILGGDDNAINSK